MVDTVLTGEPYSKERQLSRGTRRYRRKVASPKQWQAIIAAKGGRCRICGTGSRAGHMKYQHMHHLIPRARGGDDVADNIVSLCHGCHDQVTREAPIAREILAANLSPSERAYVVGKLGEDGLSRLFGATR